jgi:hypothetical protein
VATTMSMVSRFMTLGLLSPPNLTMFLLSSEMVLALIYKNKPGHCAPLNASRNVSATLSTWYTYLQTVGELKKKLMRG